MGDMSVPAQNAIINQQKFNSEAVNVIGGGLAGSEAAYQLAKRGIKVNLFEMRPLIMNKIHQGGELAELVCSNSLGSVKETTGSGLLKKELALLDSLILKTAYQWAVPAGNALAVDRHQFAQAITQTIAKHPLINLSRTEVKAIPHNTISIISSGPLSSESLAEAIKNFCQQENLFFFDAAAPIIDGESIDMSRVFWGSRYSDDLGDYLNCPLTRGEYERFYQELIQGEVVPFSDFEPRYLFEGCMPIEELAKRGFQTLTFGPLKPVGLTPPDHSKPYAVLQLRKENTAGSMFNVVGFQTRLKWGEQKRLLRLIPGLENVEFHSYGVMHRNTYINSPQILKPTMQAKKDANIFFAGQLTGVEGYLESSLSGLWAGINAGRLLRGQKTIIPPIDIPSGALFAYITTPKGNFQPLSFNFGLLPPLSIKAKRQERRKIQAQRVIKNLEQLLIKEF